MPGLDQVLFGREGLNLHRTGGRTVACETNFSHGHHHNPQRAQPSFARYGTNSDGSH